MCAAVAIAGVPPFSGFKSKDEILLAAHHHAPWMYWVGVVTAGMTAFYVFRAMFLAFFGKYRGHAHPHEAPPVMYLPLVALAALSLGGGYLSVPHWLEPMFPVGDVHHDSTLVMISVAAGVIGIGLAFLFYVVSPGLPEGLARALSGPYKLVYNKYFVDEAYDAAVVQPIIHGSRTVLWRGMDAGVIDGIVNGLGKGSRRFGGSLRRIQSGNIRSYAAWVVLGSILAITALGLIGGAR